MKDSLDKFKYSKQKPKEYEEWELKIQGLTTCLENELWDDGLVKILKNSEFQTEKDFDMQETGWLSGRELTNVLQIQRSDHVPTAT